MGSFRKWLATALLFASFFALSEAVRASEYPTGPITLIVPFAAGGSTDQAARIIAHRLGLELGQTIVIDNRAGAAGIAGAVAAANAAPNGYTLLYGGSAVLAANVSLHKSLAYDPIKSFEPISQTVFSPGVLAINVGVPSRTLADFIEYAKNNLGKLNYGSAGVATSQHIAGALLANLANLSMVHVPYKGGALATNDLVGKRLDVIIGPVSELLPHIRAGSLVALGVTSQKETPLLPGVPPIASVLPGYSVPVWQSFVAPAGTSPAVIDRIQAGLARAMVDSDVRRRLGDLGLEPLTSSPEDFKALLPKEIERWRALITLAGATAE